MAQTFTAIPDRSNGPPYIDANWFNLLKNAGISLEALVGSGYVGATTFTIANNVSAQNVTGLSFDGTLYRSVFIDYQVYRNTTSTGATERVQTGTLILNFKTVAAAWSITETNKLDDAGVTFDVSVSGTTAQVIYTSDNQTGTAATSKMTFTARTIGV